VIAPLRQLTGLSRSCDVDKSRSKITPAEADALRRSTTSGDTFRRLVANQFLVRPRESPSESTGNTSDAGRQHRMVASRHHCLEAAAGGGGGRHRSTVAGPGQRRLTIGLGRRGTGAASARRRQNETNERQQDCSDNVRHSLRRLQRTSTLLEPQN